MCEKIVKVCFHSRLSNFNLTDFFFVMKSFESRTFWFLRYPVVGIRIQLLFLSYFFLGTGHLIAASTPPDQEFIVAIVFTVMDHNIIKHWSRGFMFWCSNCIFPFFSQFGKKHGRKIVQGNCIYSVWLFYQANISGQGVAGEKLH